MVKKGIRQKNLDFHFLSSGDLYPVIVSFGIKRYILVVENANSRHKALCKIFPRNPHVIGCQFDLKFKACTGDFFRELLQKREQLKQRYIKTTYVSKETINTLIKPFFFNLSRILIYTRIVIYIGKTMTHTVSSSVF